MYKNRVMVHAGMSETFEEIMKTFKQRRTEQSIAGDNKDSDRVVLEFVFNKNFYLDKNFPKFLKTIQNKYITYNQSIHPDEIVFATEDEIKTYTASEWKKLEAAEKLIKKNGYDFGFEDNRRLWAPDEVRSAQEKIGGISSRLKVLPLSPLEKLLQGYMLTTNKIYDMEKRGENTADSRSLYGCVSTKRRVCVGYSEILKSIIEESGIEGIKLYRNSVACTDDNKTLAGTHQNLIAHVKDEKYGIDGYYYLDPTWDSRTNEREDLLNFFMVPLTSIHSITKHKVIDRNSTLPINETREKNIERGQGDEVSYYQKIPAANITSNSFTPSYSMIKDFAALYPEETMKYTQTVRLPKLSEQNEGITGDQLCKDYFSHKGQTWDIATKMRTSSETISVDSIKQALYNVLSTNNPDATPEGVREEVERFIAENMKHVSSHFDSNHSNDTFSIAHREAKSAALETE